MKQITILSLLSLFLVSFTIDDYPKKLILHNPHTKIEEIYYIVLGSDDHEYVTNNACVTCDWKILFHYPSCKKCKKDTL